jgi:hypothetical protein
MFENIFFYLIIYFISSLSILGYGLILANYSKNYFEDINLGEIGILGILFTIVFSIFSNFFLAHGYIHNLLFILLGIIFFFYYSKKVSKNSIKVFLIVFLLIFISFPTFKSHDDFSYYHFPYSYYLTQYSHLFGLGNLNHGFRTPSSIFYINSLFYLPFFKYYLFNLPAVLIFGFFNLNMILKLIKNFKTRINRDEIFFIISILIFVNIFFYRLPEHGTDRSAQILILILFLEYFLLIHKNSDINSAINKILIYISIIISLKSFYVLYIIFIPALLFFLYENNYLKLLKSFYQFKNFYFNLLIIVFALVLFLNFSNSGCLLYPIFFTCFDTFSWAIPIEQVKNMNLWYEQWAKAGAGPNFRVENPEQYIKGFNWVSNWIDKYFFNKFLDFFAGLLLVAIILILTFYNNKINRIKLDKHFFIFYFTIFLLFFEWFYNHPSLRYGGYVLVFSIIFLPLIIILKSFKTKNEKIKILILITLLTITFEVRNINRLHKEYKIYNYNFIKDFRYNVEKDYFRINNKINQRLNNNIILRY